MQKVIDMEEVRAGYETFMENKKSLMLSLVDEVGNPFSSIAACVQIDGKFYVYISKIAEHYALLERAQVVDVLLIADEVATQNHFATERARLQCMPKLLNDEGNEEVFAKFDEVHNAALMKLLRTLDFSLFELAPTKGRYVIGFGKAFDIDIAEDTMTHVVIDKK